MRVLRGSLISQRDPQNNDEIGDPGSPISWGPQNFMTGTAIACALSINKLGGSGDMLPQENF